MTLFSLSVILFLIMDPIGSIGSYLGLVKDLPPSRQRWVVLREMLFALIAMMVFNVLGEWIFNVIQVDEVTVSLSSGVILFLTAVKILFPTTDSPRANLPAGEPFIIPLAIPLIAGPSLLATIMLFARLDQSEWQLTLAILIAWAIALVILLLAAPLQRILGKNGLMACERLMGMILVLLAIQRLGEGIQLFVAKGV